MKTKAQLIEEISSLKTARKNDETTIQSLKESVAKKESLLEAKDSQLDEKDSRLEEKDSRLEEKDSQIEEKDSQIEEKNKRIEQLQKLESWYIEQLKLRQIEKFGKSSEKFDANQMTLSDLFNEAEELREQTMPEPTEEIITKPKKSRGKKRGDAYKDLPVETVEYVIPEEEAICDICKEPLHVMKKEVRKELKVIPAKISVVEHVTYVYSCRNCEKTGTEGNIIKADSPKALIPKSLVSPSVLAFIMNQKYTLALPLYRQEQEWRRLGVKLSRQNLSNWIIKGANLLKPLEDALKQELNRNKILHADETTIEVLKEDDREAHAKSYMWLYATPASAENQVVLYDYQIGRSGTFAKAFLKGWTGEYLCCDGYAGYHKLEGIKLCGCYAHLRRYFHQAHEIGKCEKAKKCMDLLAPMFALEKQADKEDYTSEQRLAMRQEKYPELLEAFYKYLEEISLTTLPKSALGKAIQYAQNQKVKFYTMLEDGNIELTNNRAERFIKPFVIGRKNFLFSNTPNGARSSATIYSIIQTALANGLKPMDYLQYVFEQLQADPDVAVDKLMPWSKEVPDSCKNILEK